MSKKTDEADTREGEEIIIPPGPDYPIYNPDTFTPTVIAEHEGSGIFESDGVHTRYRSLLDGSERVVVGDVALVGASISYLLGVV